MRYYDPQHNRLIYYERAATPEFWDLHWQAEDFARTIRSLNRFVIRWTRRYLPPGGRARSQRPPKTVPGRWRLDPTHFTEYTLPSLLAELQDAGLEVESYNIQFGEFYGVIKITTKVINSQHE
jgi:hypothetical protein